MPSSDIMYSTEAIIRPSSVEISVENGKKAENLRSLAFLLPSLQRSSTSQLNINEGKLPFFAINFIGEVKMLG